MPKLRQQTASLSKTIRQPLRVFRAIVKVPMKLPSDRRLPSEKSQNNRPVSLSYNSPASSASENTPKSDESLVTMSILTANKFRLTIFRQTIITDISPLRTVCPFVLSWRRLTTIKLCFGNNLEYFICVCHLYFSKFSLYSSLLNSTLLYSILLHSILFRSTPF